MSIVLFNQILVMFILMAIGAFLSKKKLLDKNGALQIGNILLIIVVPIIIINSFCVEYNREKLHALGITFIISIFVLIIALLISKIFFNKKPIYNFAASFSNVGFIGIPLVAAVFDGEAVFYITCIIAQLVVLQWTYGLFVITDDKKFINFKTVIFSPVVISFIIGLVIFILNIQVPYIVSETFGFITSLNTPLAMIICGFYLSQCNIKKMFTNKELYYFAFVRLIFIPIVTVLFMILIPNDYLEMKLAILIAASTPTGANITFLASKYDKDYELAVQCVCLSTLLSIVTIPIIAQIATNLF